MLMGLFLTLLALEGIIAIMVWIVQLPFIALLINIGLIALAAGIVQGPLVALLAIIGCRRHRIGAAVGHRARHPTPSHHHAGCWFGARRS